MERFFIKTMGCKSNQLEGALIEENLIKNGLAKAEKIADANIFILNSCTVTHKSDKEAFYILQKAKQNNPSLKTVLTGCIAQIEKDNLLNNPNIDIVLGNDEKSKRLREIDKQIGRSTDYQEMLKLTKEYLKITNANKTN